MNILATTVAPLDILTTLPAADLDDLFFAAVNIETFMAIFRTAWWLADAVSLEHGLGGDSLF